MSIFFKSLLYFLRRTAYNDVRNQLKVVEFFLKIVKTGVNRMSNKLYERYQTCCMELEQKMKKYQGSSEDAKKLRGALATELLKQEIDSYLNYYNKSFKVSAANSYIAGSKFEYDLLLVKENACPFMGLLYSPEDVIGIIECKAGGLFDVNKDTDHIATVVNCAQKINPHIRFGYITMSENVPVNSYHRNGKPTVRHWDLTVEYLDQKIQCPNINYAVTLHKGNTLCDEGLDEEFKDFIEFFIKEAE